jgi:hypothetical protein
MISKIDGPGFWGCGWSIDLCDCDSEYKDSGIYRDESCPAEPANVRECSD